MNIRRLAAVFATLLLSAAAYAAAPAGRIYDTQAARDISPEELVKQLSEADIVLVGEKHDEAAHHAAELWLLQQTADVRKNGSVLLEMLDSTQQKSVSEVQQWLLAGGDTPARRLSEKMEWNPAWNWQDYSAVVAEIMHSPAKVLAANPPRAETRKAAAFVPSGKFSSDAQVREALGSIMGGNHGSTEGLVSMQQFKDHTMTQNLIAAPKPAWLLAGAIHTSKRLGVPLFLRDAAVSGKVKVLVLTHDTAGMTHEHGDYIWYLHKQP